MIYITIILLLAGLDMPEDSRERFLKVYADIPIAVREEIIMVLDEKPITWNAAFVEVKNNTENSKRILQTLEKLGFI